MLTRVYLFVILVNKGFYLFMKIISRQFFVFILLSAVFFITGIGVGQNIKLERELSSNSSKLNLSISNDNPDFVDKTIDFDLFWDVWQALENKYYQAESVTDQDLYYGSIRGMVGALDDPYTVFFNPEEAEEFNQEMEGKFEGIGAEIGIKNDILTIISPLSGTPADLAGLRPGDKVLAIDDFDTSNIFVEEAVRRIRGPRGSLVILKILHKNAEASEDISIMRDEIIIPTISSEMKGQNKDIAYLRIFSFIDNTAQDFEKTVNLLLKQKPKGLILDLRSNPGGYLDSAVKIAGFWVKDGAPVVLERFADDKDQVYKSAGPAILKDLKTIVLVNEGSASASEILAGALRDYDYAVIVGEQTFGKGSVQDYSSLPGGSALKVTVAEWLTPGGASINKEGIAPDIAVEMTADDYNKDLDPQLQRAVELLE